MRCLVLKEKDAFINLPTGFGKSMIFLELPQLFSSLQPKREKDIVVAFLLGQLDEGSSNSPYFPWHKCH